MGEGTGALILEEYEHAKARGAKIYAELIGAAKSMELAMQDAEIQFEQIDYLNPHAASTPLGDLAKLNAVAKVFKGNTKLDISATKSMTGHLLGAAGAVEAIIYIKAIQENIIPATIKILNWMIEFRQALT